MDGRLQHGAVERHLKIPAFRHALAPRPRACTLVVDHQQSSVRQPQHAVGAATDQQAAMVTGKLDLVFSGFAPRTRAGNRAQASAVASPSRRRLARSAAQSGPASHEASAAMALSSAAGSLVRSASSSAMGVASGKQQLDQLVHDAAERQDIERLRRP